MPTLPKYRKSKRPTVVAKKNMKRRSFDKKSVALIYEKLKSNNRALARALTQQKEETQQLTRENLALTRELQESRYVKKKHVEALSVILKNSREAMDHVVKATEQVVCTISKCNTFLQPENANASRQSAPKESNRRGSTKSPNKSPARGVVQPMVSGHAIAQPAIALSRLRIAMPPSVSDIEETSESPPGTGRTQRIPANRTTRPVNRTIIPLMPQRIRVSSPRDETLDDRRLSSRYQKRKSRNSSRHSGDHEPLSPRNSITPIDTSFRSPRVSLEDVSRLMHNSHSINVRNLMDTSTEEPSNTTQSTSESASPSPHDDFIRPTTPPARAPTQISPVSPVSPLSPSPTSSPVSSTSTPTFQFDHRGRKSRKKRNAEKAKAEETAKKHAFDRVDQRDSEDDPLEGPSWRYSDGAVDGDDGGGVNGSHDETHGTSNTNNETNDASLGNSEASRISETSPQMFEGSIRDSAGSSKTNRFSVTMVNTADGCNGSDDDERCQRIDMQRMNPDEETGTFTAVFSRNVCMSRGRVEDFDPDDFTMMRRPNEPFKPLDFGALVMPEIPPQELEGPLVTPAEVMVEPEITKTIQIIAGFNQQVNQIIGGDGLPNVTINTSVAMPVIDTAGRESEDDTTILVAGRRNRVVVPIVESSSESESASPPKKRSVKGRSRVKASKRRDPKSAKVVLEKLKEPGEKKRSGSPDPRRSTLNGYAHRTSNSLTSDSESSNASFGSNGRPKRNKAPTNFAEPSLRKKLRRQ